MWRSSGPFADAINRMLDRGFTLLRDPQVLRQIKLERVRALRQQRRSELQQMYDRMHADDDARLL